MANVDIKARTAEGSVELSSTANTVQGFRVYLAERVTVECSSAIELHYGEDDGATVTAGSGKAIAADTPWTIPCDFADQAADGYFYFGISSATSAAEVEWVAETGRAT